MTRPADAADADLLAAHVAGDEDAFSELVRRHRDRLWAVALRTTGDREEAADAVQEALLSAFRRAETFRGDSAVTTWLHRIVVNACLDRIRRRAARPTTPLGELDPVQPGEEAAGADLRIDVDRALAALPGAQRLALVLVDMQGLAVADAAQILGVPAGTVKSRCARGRAALAPLLRVPTAAQPPGRPPAGKGSAPAGNRDAAADVPPHASPATTTTSAPSAAAAASGPADTAEGGDPA